MSRYWRLIAVGTPSGVLNLTKLELSDGTNTYPATGTTWDLGSAIAITSLRMAGATAAEFPTAFLLQSSSDNINWVERRNAIGIVFPGPSVDLVASVFEVNTVLAFQFDSNLNDSSFSLASVTINGTVSISNVESRFGGFSARFNSSNAGLAIANQSQLNLINTNYTIEMWCYFLANPNGASLINHEYAVSTDSFPYTIGFCDGSIGSASGNRLFFGYHQVQTWRGAASTWEPTLNQWHHIALTRSGNEMRLFANGVQVAGMTVTVEPIAPSRSTLFVGRRWDLPGVMTYHSINGFIDHLQVVSGLAKYTSNFTPHSQPFLVDNFSTRVLANVQGIELIVFRDPGQTDSRPISVLDANLISFDVQDGGLFRITGTVKEKALPVNTPLQRRVMLIEERSRRVIRETWSDAVTGEYVFNQISGAYTYTVVSYDHINNYRAVIADNLTPEPMP